MEQKILLNFFTEMFSLFWCLSWRIKVHRHEFTLGIIKFGKRVFKPNSAKTVVKNRDFNWSVQHFGEKPFGLKSVKGQKYYSVINNQVERRTKSTNENLFEDHLVGYFYIFNSHILSKTVLLEVVHLLQDDTVGFCPILHNIHIFFLLFAKNSIWISWVENWYRGKNWLVWEKSWRTLVAVATFINSITDHVARCFQISHFFPIFSTIG